MHRDGLCTDIVTCRYVRGRRFVRRRTRHSGLGILQAANVDADWLTGEALPDSVKEVEKYLLEIGEETSP